MDPETLGEDGGSAVAEEMKASRTLQSSSPAQSRSLFAAVGVSLASSRILTRSYRLLYPVPSGGSPHRMHASCNVTGGEPTPAEELKPRSLSFYFSHPVARLRTDSSSWYYVELLAGGFQRLQPGSSQRDGRLWESPYKIIYEQVQREKRKTAQQYFVSVFPDKNTHSSALREPSCLQPSPRPL